MFGRVDPLEIGIGGSLRTWCLMSSRARYGGGKAPANGAGRIFDAGFLVDQFILPQDSEWQGNPPGWSILIFGSRPAWNEDPPAGNLDLVELWILVSGRGPAPWVGRSATRVDLADPAITVGVLLQRESHPHSESAVGDTINIHSLSLQSLARGSLEIVAGKGKRYRIGLSLRGTSRMEVVGYYDRRVDMQDFGFSLLHPLELKIDQPGVDLGHPVDGLRVMRRRGVYPYTQEHFEQLRIGPNGDPLTAGGMKLLLDGAAWSRETD